MEITKQPLFSVVVPVYNVEKYIEKCIDSIISQTYKQFEVIFVNDGSTDKSEEIIKQYNDPRFNIINQKNMGLAAARNTGINVSRGIFVALLDSDDFWHKNKLNYHYKLMQANPNIDISYSASHFVDEDNMLLGIGQHPKIKNITPQHILCRNPIGNGSSPVICRSLLNKVARKIHTENGERVEYFDESLRQSEDIEFWIRCALDKNATFVGIKEALTYYRVNASGLSANLDKQFDFWKKGIEKNQQNHPDFFKKWYPLAKAYQQRYLARRAVQSGNAKLALDWFKSALKSDAHIIIYEPKRTFITFCAIICGFLPSNMNNFIQKKALLVARQKSSRL